MRKGITGHTLVIIISLIVAMIGLVLLWIFLNNAVGSGNDFAHQIGCSICGGIKKAIGIAGFVMNCGCVT